MVAEVFIFWAKSHVRTILRQVKKTWYNTDFYFSVQIMFPNIIIIISENEELPVPDVMFRSAGEHFFWKSMHMSGVYGLLVMSETKQQHAHSRSINFDDEL